MNPICPYKEDEVNSCVPLQYHSSCHIWMANYFNFATNLIFQLSTKFREQLHCVATDCRSVEQMRTFCKEHPRWYGLTFFAPKSRCEHELNSSSIEIELFVSINCMNKNTPTQFLTNQQTPTGTYHKQPSLKHLHQKWLKQLLEQLKRARI